MGAYHQMGHASRNLAMDTRLRDLYAGAIMSPVNDDPEAVRRLCSDLSNHESIFDPQMYNPRSTRGALPQWPYFKKAAEAYETDVFTVSDWANTVRQIVADCSPLGHHAICSPAPAQKESSDDELGYAIQIGDALADVVASTSLDGLQTGLLRTSNLEAQGRPETVASILTGGRLQRLYLVPRWTENNTDLSDEKELVGFIRTVGFVAPERRTLVGFCGPEMILWKAAGAESVATGKYANQQRFALNRWEEKKGGGLGSIAYYFEESLLTWLRMEDIVRLDALKYTLGLANDPFLPLIRSRIAALQANPPRREPVLKNGRPVMKSGKPVTKRVGPPDWTSFGWSQWLWWFADAERRLSNGTVTARSLVEHARRNWTWLAARRFVPVDQSNDGQWLGAWLKALDAIAA